LPVIISNQQLKIVSLKSHTLPVCRIVWLLFYDDIFHLIYYLYKNSNMLSLVATLPGWLFWLLLFIMLAAFSLGGLLLIRKKLHPALLAKSHDVAGFYTGIIGVLYTVVVAYCIVTVWEDYADAEANMHRESSAIADMHRSSPAFSDTFAAALKNHLQQYTDAVINDEWKQLGFSDRPNGKASFHFNALYGHINRYQPVTTADNTNYANLLANLNELSDTRRIRLLDGRSSIPASIWTVLFAGALITMAFTWFFRVENLRLQAIMILLIAVVISLTLYIIISLSFPFNGSSGLQPEPYEWLQQNNFKQADKLFKE
jgi:Protein of unknown function (DUF4239)